MARTGGFTSAAREVYLSHSAVSHSVKGLEQDVGCRLFDRVGKKVLLTQAGEMLLVHADRILHEMGQARESIDPLNKWGHSRIRIGASSTTCQYILPSVLRRFNEDYPEWAITIKLAFEPLFSDELMFIVSAGHEWAVSGNVIRMQISKQKFVLYNRGSQTFRMIEQFFQRDGIGIMAPWVA